jgi:hypothetical protein
MNKMQAKKLGCAGNIDPLLYNTTTQQYTQMHSVVLDKLCNAVTVINKGNTIVMWNGLPIFPLESMSVGGNEREVFVGRVDLAFRLPVAADGIPIPVNPVNSSWVIQKFYEDKNFI